MIVPVEVISEHSSDTRNSINEGATLMIISMGTILENSYIRFEKGKKFNGRNEQLNLPVEIIPLVQEITPKDMTVPVVTILENDLSVHRKDVVTPLVLTSHMI